jgi:adenylate cyclase
VLRRFIAALSDAQEEVWPTFSALLAGRLAHRNFAGEAQPPTFIDFAGPPGTFPRISFQRLLRPDARLDPAIGAVKDRGGIVAPETRFQDIHLTPYARGFPKWRPQMMSGAEVHANIVETLQMGRSPGQ